MEREQEFTNKVIRLTNNTIANLMDVYRQWNLVFALILTLFNICLMLTGLTTLFLQQMGRHGYGNQSTKFNA